MAKYRYDGNLDPVDYTVAIHLPGGVTLEQGQTAEVPDGHVDRLRKKFVLVKVDEAKQPNRAS